jgi:hypothetical protein
MKRYYNSRVLWTHPYVPLTENVLEVSNNLQAVVGVQVTTGWGASQEYLCEFLNGYQVFTLDSAYFIDIKIHRNNSSDN